MLTFACVFVRGEYPYTVEYVRRLRAMVAKFSDRPFQFVCLTDQPDAMPTGVEPITIAKLPGCFALWSKLHLFNRAHGLQGRIVYLDLDTLVVSSLAPIVDFDAFFALTEDVLVQERAHLDRDQHGRRLVRRFNSSVMVWDAHMHHDLYDDWTPAIAAHFSTDQDWIAHHAQDAEGMPAAWFPRISRVQPPWPAEAKVVLVKKPKNHEAVQRWPWFEAHWGGWEQAA